MLVNSIILYILNEQIKTKIKEFNQHNE